MKTRTEKIIAYKNSDGFITPDKDLAIHREKLILKLKNIPDDKWLEKQLLKTEIEISSWDEEKKSIYKAE